MFVGEKNHLDSLKPWYITESIWQLAVKYKTFMIISIMIDDMEKVSLKELTTLGCKKSICIKSDGTEKQI